jgi:AcrR family transcriptional regulator
MTRRSKTSLGASQNGNSDANAVRDRILKAFSAKAKRSGIRAVLMGELASQLRMSAMTLYKHFVSKDELVLAMVDAWAMEIAAIQALEWEKVDSCSSALEVLLSWADAWTLSLSEVTPAFFSDLHRDYPVAWDRFQARITERKMVAARFLSPYVRDDLHVMTVFAILDNLAMQASDPRFVERLGISRREAVRTAVSVWGGGALLQRAKLRPVPDAERPPRRLEPR